MRRRTLLASAALASLPLGAKAQGLTKMTIATGVDPAFSQFYVAKEAGLFEKNGLDVTINTINSTSTISTSGVTLMAEMMSSSSELAAPAMDYSAATE